MVPLGKPPFDKSLGAGKRGKLEVGTGLFRNRPFSSENKFGARNKGYHPKTSIVSPYEVQGQREVIGVREFEAYDDKYDLKSQGRDSEMALPPIVQRVDPNMLFKDDPLDIGSLSSKDKVPGPRILSPSNALTAYDKKEQRMLA